MKINQRQKLAVTAVGLYLIYLYGCGGPGSNPSSNPMVNPMLLVDEYLKELPLGNIAFNAPKAMKVDEQIGIHVLVSGSSSVGDIRAELERRIKEKEFEAYAIKLSPLMEAHLTGENFTIQAVTPEKQAVASSATTQWQWDVTPRRGGLQVLHLAMNVIVYVRNSPEPRTVQTFDRTIEIKVSTMRRVTDWARDNWFWVLPLIGAVIAIVKWILKKSIHKQSDKPKGPIGFQQPDKNIAS